MKILRLIIFSTLSLTQVEWNLKKTRRLIYILGDFIQTIKLRHYWRLKLFNYKGEFSLQYTSSF